MGSGPGASEGLVLRFCRSAGDGLSAGIGCSCLVGLTEGVAASPALPFPWGRAAALPLAWAGGGGGCCGGASDSTLTVSEANAAVAAMASAARFCRSAASFCFAAAALEGAAACSWREASWAARMA